MNKFKTEVKSGGMVDSEKDVNRYQLGDGTDRCGTEEINQEVDSKD